jgi:hypothetical protein
MNAPVIYPAASARSKGHVMLAVTVTLLVVIATLVILLMNAVCTGMFVFSPPRGDSAMGLVVPIVGLGGAILVMGLAGILASFRAGSSALALMHSSPGVAALLTIVITVGAALAAGMAFMLWCEPVSVSLTLRVVTIPVGIVLGVLGPILLAAALLMGVWTTKASVISVPATSAASLATFKAMFWALCVLSVVGYGLGGSFFAKTLGQQVQRQAASMNAEVVRKIKVSEWFTKPREQQLSEALAKLATDSPLCNIVEYLPEQPGYKPLNRECRFIVTDRALRVPNLNEQLVECMESREYIYRQGAAEFLRSVPQEQFDQNMDAWGEALVKGVAATADGIACRPSWMTETFDAKPDPLGHVKSLIGAVDRFRAWKKYPLLQAELQQMTNDAELLTPNKHLDKLMKVLADAGYKPKPPPR